MTTFPVRPDECDHRLRGERRYPRVGLVEDCAKCGTVWSIERRPDADPTIVAWLESRYALPEMRTATEAA